MSIGFEEPLPNCFNGLYQRTSVLPSIRIITLHHHVTPILLMVALKARRFPGVFGLR